MEARMLFVVDGKLRTILGWSPGLRMALCGRVLPCGCLVGSYETWDGDVFDVVDAHDERCTDRSHATNSLIPYPERAGISL
jgi:hypothetical protein